MKRDYLKNLDIGGGAHLSDELIEQIMAEALKKQLVAYQRAENIQPQESRRITLELDPRCLMYWDIHAPISESTWGTKGKWLPVQGKRQVLHGFRSVRGQTAGKKLVKITIVGKIGKCY